MRAGPGLTHRTPPRRVIPNLFPKYIRAPNGPEANPVKQLQPSKCVYVGGVGVGLLGCGFHPGRGMVALTIPRLAPR